MACNTTVCLNEMTMVLHTDAGFLFQDRATIACQLSSPTEVYAALQPFGAFLACSSKLVSYTIIIPFCTILNALLCCCTPTRSLTHHRAPP